MAIAISLYCDAAWETLLDITLLGAVIEAERVTDNPIVSAEEGSALFRSPRVVITEAIAFTEQYAAACLAARNELPAMPIPDPWDTQRKTAVEKRIERGVRQVVGQAERKWGMRRSESGFFQWAARTDLLKELAAQWEAGQRKYYEALQKCDADPATKTAIVPKKSGGKQRLKPWKKRGMTVNEYLVEMCDSPEGRRELFAAGTATGIARCVGCSHGAVADSEAWHNKIKPMLDGARASAKASRLEREERRQDRRFDRRRK